MHLSTIILAALAGAAAAVPATTSHKLHEKRELTPEHWTKGSELHPKAMLPVRIGMNQERLDEAHDLLMEVSDHNSPKYGKWYTPEEIVEIFAPKQSAVDVVRDWLHDAGIAKERVSQSWNKQWIEFDATAAEMGKLLKTKFHSYTHGPSGKEHPACDEYHVPDYVQRYVDYITPGIKLFHPGRVNNPSSDTVHVDMADLSDDSGDDGSGESAGLSMTKRQVHGGPGIIEKLPLPLAEILDIGLLKLCGTIQSPQCIAKQYQIPALNKTPITGNELGIFEDLGDHYSQTDLSLFFTTIADIEAKTGPIGKPIDGATTKAFVTSAGAESDLDFQVAFPIIHPQGAVLFQTDDDVYENNYNFTGFLNNFFDGIDGSYCNFKAFGASSPSPLDPQYPHNVRGGFNKKLQCGRYKPTNVISISYSGDEASLPLSYQKRQCAEIMKLGMQGTSVVVSSGDAGVAGQGGCLLASNTTKVQTFNPAFPLTCPYVTAVGGTILPPGGKVGDQEVAVRRFGSGGGFSNIYAQPAYQRRAVKGYLTKHTPPYTAYSTLNAKKIGPGQYNNLGRGYPDVAATGDKLIVFNKGLPTIVGGTSASTPLFASLLTRVNEERLRAGKKTVGFVNPALYAHPDIFSDIVTGSNPGCGTSGFSCAKGWDPVTGLGSPNYPKLLDMFMALP